MRVTRFSKIGVLWVFAGIAGCVSMPSGPGVMVLSGQGKPFEVFRADQAECQYYAQQTVVAPEVAGARNSATQSAVAGTVLGAAAGAGLGSASGHAGGGAAIGAGSGFLFGSMAGSSTYNDSGHLMQDHYDAAYLQCMYAKGNQIPVTLADQTLPQYPPISSYPSPNTSPPPINSYPMPPW